MNKKTLLESFEESNKQPIVLSLVDQRIIKYSRILRDKTMNDKFMYTPNFDKQNCPYSMVESVDTTSLVQSIKI